MRRFSFYALFLLLASCSPVRRARSEIEKGSFADARELLRRHLEKHPDDTEAEILLADIDLRQGNAASAKIRLQPLYKNTDLTWRISQLYRDAAHRLEPSGETAALALAASEAAHLNPLAATDMCGTVLGRAQRERGQKWRPLTTAAATIDADCQRKTTDLLQAWLEDYDVTNGSVDDALQVAVALRELQPDDSLEIARRLRGVARKFAEEDRFKAEELSRHLAELDRRITAEPETASLLGKVGAIEVRPDLAETSAPSRLDTTKRVLLQIGDLVTAYRQKNGTYPIASNVDDLLAKIGTGVVSVDPYDGWGQPIHYVSNGAKARLISAGADQTFEAVSRNLNTPVAKVTFTGMDIVWENGVIVQAPESSQQ